ncbi:GspE/PulE family protein, partial [Methylicorpusculum sp.]|uniref:GspE/PulE family protein n=1 Tax=Methylicorpusculum sp. TaxID=2713644 RepID=UPI002ABD0B1C
MVKKTVGSILVDAGVVTPEQVQECAKEVEQAGGRLESCLIDKKFTTELAIARAYADSVSVPFVEKITDKMIDLELLAKASLKFLRDNAVMPLRLENQIVILLANPFYFQPLDELNLLLGGGLNYAVAPAKVIIDGINRYYPLETTKEVMAELEEEGEKELDVDFEAIEEKDIMAMATEAPIIKLVNHVLFQAAKRGASDIHIEPFEKEVRVRYRIDGVMYAVMTLPKRLQGAISSRIKIMANLDIAEKRIPQDGRIDLKVAGRPIDIRVSDLPTSFGERIVMRLLDKSRTFAKLGALGFDMRDLKLITENIKRPNGIIYVTGPTGSGKTTTLYSVLG